MSRTRMYAQNEHSKSAKALSEMLGVKRIKHRDSKFSPKETDQIINWGSSSLPVGYSSVRVLNRPEVVGKVTNKLKFFREMRDSGTCVVPWTTSKLEVKEWLDRGSLVVARTKLTGHSGEGIVLIENEEGIVDAPLYTKYIPKKFEYRLHFICGELMWKQKKGRSLDTPDDNVDWKIRNRANGFIYMNNNVSVPSDVVTEANNAFYKSGLDFGAVDVIYNEKKNKAYVLEINTAPGLEGSTLEIYRDYFKSVFRIRKQG